MEYRIRKSDNEHSKMTALYVELDEDTASVHAKWQMQVWNEDADQVIFDKHHFENNFCEKGSLGHFLNATTDESYVTILFTITHWNVTANKRCCNCNGLL